MHARTLLAAPRVVVPQRLAATALQSLTGACKDTPCKNANRINSVRIITLLNG